MKFFIWHRDETLEKIEAKDYKEAFDIADIHDPDYIWLFSEDGLKIFTAEAIRVLNEL